MCPYFIRFLYKFLHLTKIKYKKFGLFCFIYGIKFLNFFLFFFFLSFLINSDNDNLCTTFDDILNLFLSLFLSLSPTSLSLLFPSLFSQSDFFFSFFFSVEFNFFFYFFIEYHRQPTKLSLLYCETPNWLYKNTFESFLDLDMWMDEMDGP